MFLQHVPAKLVKARKALIVAPRNEALVTVGISVLVEMARQAGLVAKFLSAVIADEFLLDVMLVRDMLTSPVSKSNRKPNPAPGKAKPGSISAYRENVYGVL